MKIEPFKMTREEKERYSRQLSLLKTRGQEKLKKARALIVGAGGLGSILSRYLVMAGVGTVKLVDNGKVDLPDLNRQFYSTDDIDKPKVTALAEKLRVLNPNVVVEPEDEELTERNVQKFVKWSSIVLDCLDTLKARLMLSKACQELKKPLIHGAVEGMLGYQMTCIPGGNYLDKLYSQKKEKKGRFPIVGPSAGIIGSIQALEAIKVITGDGVLNTDMMIFDGKDNSIGYIRVK